MVKYAKSNCFCYWGGPVQLAPRHGCSLCIPLFHTPQNRTSRSAALSSLLNVVMFTLAFPVIRRSLNFLFRLGMDAQHVGQKFALIVESATTRVM